jgi:hypothetical protein
VNIFRDWRGRFASAGGLAAGKSQAELAAERNARGKQLRDNAFANIITDTDVERVGSRLDLMEARSTARESSRARREARINNKRVDFTTRARREPPSR